MGLYPNAYFAPAAIIDGDYQTPDEIEDVFSRLADPCGSVMKGKTVLIGNKSDRRDGPLSLSVSINEETACVPVYASQMEQTILAFKSSYAEELALLPEHEIAMVFAAFRY